MRLIFLFTFFSLYFLQTHAQYKKWEGSVQIKIVPVFGKEALVLQSKQYVNANADTLYIDGFRFYIGRISVNNVTDNSYYLVDAEDSGSKTILLNHITEGSYKALQFIIGVDSLANVSGAMGGDLDPSKGMYWAWNTGYIMAKLEGRSSKCKTLHHAFEFHIGGYLLPNNTARKVKLETGNDIVVKKGKTTIIEIKADIAEWFRGPVKIDLAKTNSITIPGIEAMMMADNYKDMFTVSKIINP